MGKKYRLVSNEERKELIQLIHQQGLTIFRAAARLGIFYPTAKAINKVYTGEKRINKKEKR